MLNRGLRVDLLGLHRKPISTPGRGLGLGGWVVMHRLPGYHMLLIHLTVMYPLHCKLLLGWLLLRRLVMLDMDRWGRARIGWVALEIHGLVVGASKLPAMMLLLPVKKQDRNCQR